MAFHRKFPVAIRDMCNEAIHATDTPKDSNDDAELDLLSEFIVNALNATRKEILDYQTAGNDKYSSYPSYDEREDLRRLRIRYASLKLALWLADGRDITEEDMKSLWTYLAV